MQEFIKEHTWDGTFYSEEDNNEGGRAINGGDIETKQ